MYAQKYLFHQGTAVDLYHMRLNNIQLAQVFKFYGFMPRMGMGELKNIHTLLPPPYRRVSLSSE